MKKYIDIGANLTDAMFRGFYHGTQRHPPDLDHVLERAWNAGLDRIIVTAGSLQDASEAISLVKESERLYTTVGVHPTRCHEFSTAESAEKHLEALATLVESAPAKVVAIGECGLDYDRLQFCEKSVQLKYFEAQLDLARRFCLPLFLHCRSSCADLVEILERNSAKCPRGGVVHSFDGSLEEAKTILDLGFDIGINGCSLKTEDNLQTVASIPAHRIHLETDAPWCEVRPSHAGHQLLLTTAVSWPAACKKERWRCDSQVKCRNEPANIVKVLEILAALKKEDADSLAAQFHENSLRLFFPGELEHISC